MKAIKPFRVSDIWRTAYSIQAMRTNTNFQRIVQSVWHTLLAWKEQLSDYEIIQPIEQLEKKVDKHNSFAEKIPLIQNDIKVANHRIDDLEELCKEHFTK